MRDKNKVKINFGIKVFCIVKEKWFIKYMVINVRNLGVFFKFLLELIEIEVDNFKCLKKFVLRIE